jgi:hypothetical protein
MRVDEGAVEASTKGTRVLGDTGDTSAKGTRAVDIIVSTPSPRVKFDMGVDATPKNPKKFPIETTVAATIEACVPDCACAICVQCPLQTFGHNGHLASLNVTNLGWQKTDIFGNAPAENVLMSAE